MKNKARFGRAKIFLGLNRSMAAMLLMAVLLGLGEKMGERFLPVYLLAVGGTAYAVGFLNAMDNFLSAIYSWVGGTISDRLGYKRAMKIYTLIAMAGYAVIILFPVWQAVLVGSVFFISWTALSLPAILSLVSSTVKKEKQTMGVSLHSLVRRIPMALGPVIGGIFITAYGIRTGARIAFGVALALGLLALWFIEKHVDEKRTQTEKHIHLRETVKGFSKPLRTLLASDILIRFAEQIPYAFVVIWVMQDNNLSAMHFSVLTVIEMAVAMLIYIPAAWLSEKTSSKLCISITFGFFTLFPLVLLVSHDMAAFSAAFVIRGLKEFGEPTRKALIVKLAPEGGKASVFGAYYLMRDIVVAVAALFSAALWSIGPAVNFLTAAGFGLIGTMLFIGFGNDMESRKAETITETS